MSSLVVGGDRDTHTTESVGDVSVGAPGLRKRLYRLHPEKTCNNARGPGFDSRQLHQYGPFLNASRSDILSGRLAYLCPGPGTVGSVHSVLDRLAEHLDRWNPGGVLGLYLFGSSVVGGLRPASDLDLLVVTGRSLTTEDRKGLVRFLVQFSGRRATVAAGRPLELTSVVRGQVVPWGYPPVCDFLYGEWLRDEFESGSVPQPHVNPDLAVGFTTLHQHARVLRGPDPSELLPEVPVEDLRQAVRDSLEPLLGDLAGDERNVLLTLARMVVTLESDLIVSKDDAAGRLLPSLPEPDRSVLALAARGYLGKVGDDWSQLQEEARATARRLAARVRALTWSSDRGLDEDAPR